MIGNLFLCHAGMCFVSFFVFTTQFFLNEEKRSCKKDRNLTWQNPFVLGGLHFIPMNFAEPENCMLYIGIPLTDLILPLFCASLI